MTLGIRYSPVGIVAGWMTHRRPPDWVSAKPKRFAWEIGLALALSMTVITNSGIRGTLPGTICAICLTLMWLESVLGLCLGCELHALLVRRGWATTDPAFEVCAGGEMRRSRPSSRSRQDGGRRRRRLVEAEAASSTRTRPSARRPILDELRATEYARLDARGDVYLDYTGGSLYAASQVEEHHWLLREGVYGNPHSVNPTSSAATSLVERARAAVLRYFNAPEDEYACIFTPNATGALRLVGEAYPFGPRDRFLATFDNHNSVNGIREFARAHGARTAYVPLEAPDLRVADERSCALPRRRHDRRPQPVRLPGAVELLRRQAPARVDRARAASTAGT